MRLSLDNHGGAVVSDADLLQRFLADRQDKVFAQLVQRHGPMVWGLCRRLLHQEADAEDAFQATFLTLFQHAVRIQKQTSLASWLYGVACRIAYKIKRTRARTQRREQKQARSEEQADDTSWDQTIRDIMDAELARLPAHYREPLLLCYLQGQSQALAAQTLGWPIGTVAGRLSRAKELLRSRLIRRGVAPAVAAGMSFELAQASVPVELLEKTLHTIHTGGTSPIALLTKGAVTTMLLSKWLTAGVIGLALTLGAGWYYSAFSMQGDGKQETTVESQPVPVKQNNKKPDDYELIQGQWRCETRHEVTGTLQSVEDLTFRGRKYARSAYQVEKGIVGERNYESNALEYVLDPKQSPRRMELQELVLNNTNTLPSTLGGGPEVGSPERLLCTYELNGDILTIKYGGFVPLHVNEQGKYAPNRNSPRATFPKQDDPNVRTKTFRRMTPPTKSEWGNIEQINNRLRENDVAHALDLLDKPIRKTIEPGQHVDLIASSKVAGKDGKIKSIFLLEDIEVLGDNRTINQDGSVTHPNRILLRSKSQSRFDNKIVPERIHHRCSTQNGAWWFYHKIKRHSSECHQ
ncbi:MAG: sigma-70 family RNA polymerase sigma factor [Gemmatales bacterium]